MPSPLETLRDRFGLSDFLPGQKAVIEHLLAGRSAAAVFPTGGGKSLCYQLPALLCEGLTLVVSPLIALMKDQIDALARRGIAAERLDSTLGLDEYRSVMQRVRDGSLKLLYVAPERFNNERFRETILRTPIALFAIDEAHCISEWGHNFRPDYLKLAEFARQCRAERVLALTATAPPTVLEDIRHAFAIEPECAIRTGFYRANLAIRTTAVAARERDATLLAELRERPPGATIVYVTLQKTAEEVAANLARAGLAAKPYHAGMDDVERAAVQDWFIAAPANIVVATIAFGMGIDKSDIRYVYHYNLAKSLENYSQEIGRAGRDGKQSHCEMFATREDLCMLENFAFGDTPTLSAIKGFVDDVFNQGDDLELSQYDLSNRHDIRNLVVRTLLTYLELDGYLQGGTPLYAEYEFQPKLSSGEILAKFEGDRRELLAGIFRQAKKGRTWFKLDAAQTAQALGQPRDRIVRALDYLGDQGLLEVRAAGVRHIYRRLKSPDDPAQLAGELHRKTLDREVRESQRLHSVLDLVEHPGCQTNLLAEYFGEKRTAGCGHCTWCESGQATVVPAAPVAKVDPGLWQRAGALRLQHPDAVGDSRSLTRLLCGIASPRLTRAKLTRDPLFGALASVPFSEVLARAEE